MRTLHFSGFYVPYDMYIYTDYKCLLPQPFIMLSDTQVAQYRNFGLPRRVASSVKQWLHAKMDHETGTFDCHKLSDCS